MTSPTAAPSRLELALCRTELPGTLTWSATKEVAFSVYSAAGEAVWSYQPQLVEPRRQSLEVASAECIIWALDWDRTTNAGESIAPGRYRLRARSLAAEADDVFDGVDFRIS